MKKLFSILTALVICLSIMGKAEAKWWIFGQGTDEIVTNYIYINNSSLDETDKSVVLFKNTLKDNTIRISGKASVRNAKIGAALISLDNKATWQKAKLSKNGYFEYTFNPELNKEYNFYIKLVDTLGKTNDIDSTYKKIKVVNENITELVMNSLNDLVQAYQNEDSKAFMQHVSNDFAGDSVNLDFALRKDFNAFDYIKLNLYPNNISRDTSGRVYVAVQYIRQVVATRDGRTYRDNGFTEFVFSNESGKFKLFSMKNPLMFGLSDASNVATGTIQNTNNDPILMVSDTSTVKQESFDDAIKEIEEGSSSTGSSSTVSSGSVVISTGSNNIAGYTFNVFAMTPNELSAPIGSSTKHEPGLGIDSISTATVSMGDFDAILLMTSDTYSVLLNDGKYMLLENDTGSGVGSTFRYKLQNDGTNNF